AAGAQCADPASTDTVRDFTAFASPVRIEILAEDPARANLAADSIERYFGEIGRDWYAFGDGELARVNEALSQGRPAVLSDRLLPLVQRAIAWQRRSAGLFDPGVCALVKLWRFDRGENIDPASAPPDAAAVDRLHDSQGSVADLQIVAN